MEPIVNRVAESDIEVYNLAALWDGAPIAELDIAPFLYRGLILRERDFRQHVKMHDWAQYTNQHVAVTCSADAIVPTWAYMLIATKLTGVARSVAFGTPQELIRDHFMRALAQEDWSTWQDKIVVVKGCGNQIVPEAAYLIATQALQGVARKLMYGEPCSSVPLWRKPKAKPASAQAGSKPVAAKPVGISPAMLPLK